MSILSDIKGNVKDTVAAGQNSGAAKFITSVTHSVQAGATLAADQINFLQGLESPGLNTQSFIGDSNGNVFIFDYGGEVKAETNTDVTDHYSESNEFMQDHAALRPAVVTLRGLVGELALLAPTGIDSLGTTLQNNLTTVQGYAGDYTPGAVAKIQGAVSKAQDINNKLNATISKGKSILKVLQGATSAPSKQASAFQTLLGLQNARTPLTVTTPNLVYGDMLITSIVALNPEDTKYWTEFTVTLKQVRIAAVTVTSFQQEATASQQRASVKNTGVNYKPVPYASSSVAPL